jgi:hypothetical protein
MLNIKVEQFPDDLRGVNVYTENDKHEGLFISLEDLIDALRDLGKTDEQRAEFSLSLASQLNDAHKLARKDTL